MVSASGGLATAVKASGGAGLAGGQIRTSTLAVRRSSWRERWAS
jgi:hypothetical protein